MKWHAAGDDLIKGAAECMKQCMGIYGMLFRIGGDEFAAIADERMYRDKEAYYIKNRKDRCLC